MAKDLNIEELLRDFPPRFESKPFYSAEGDCIQWYFEDVDGYAERIDCWLTVRRSHDDGRLTGFKLKNVSTLMKAFDALGLEVRVKGPRWEIMLKAMVAYSPLMPGAKSDPYRDLVRLIPQRQTVEVPALA